MTCRPTGETRTRPARSRSEIVRALHELTDMHQRLRVAAERLGVDDPEVTSLRADIVDRMMQEWLELMALEMLWASEQAIH